MKCVVCDSKKLKLKYKLKDRNVFQCLNCGLEILVNNKPFFYNNDYYKNNYFFEDFNDQSFYKVITNNLKLLKDDMILDIGCGKGDYLFYLSKDYPYLKKFANDLRNILPKKNIVEKFFEGSFDDISFNENFNIITMWDLFEHINNPVESLSKAKKLLKNNGKIFIYTVNSKCFLRKIGDIFYKIGFKNFIEKLYPPYHLFYFNKNNLEIICDRLDLNIISLGYNYYDTKRMTVSNFYKLIIKFIYLIESLFSDKKTNIYFITKKKDEDIDIKSGL